MAAPGHRRAPVHLGLRRGGTQERQVDQDRDLILTDLRSNKNTFTTSLQDAFQQNPTGKNGGGDPWQTDRKLGIAIHGTSE
ncbi:MAG: hypothetical protein EOP87_21225 [Verrucomicrobiaceae bacterium]|nr:MAG: hypothetical protein EOP87_21225 [Verrucomicrobiaceae bacterium]